MHRWYPLSYPRNRTVLIELLLEQNLKIGHECLYKYKKTVGPICLYFCEKVIKYKDTWLFVELNQLRP